jgi:outer membrane protein assembly factor BamD
MQRTDLIRRTIILSPVVALLFLFAACGDGAQTVRLNNTEEDFRKGMAELEDESYQEAQQIFNTIILQDPASEYADDAQFYLAESYFRDGDYKLAAFNYNRLRTSFPNSLFYKEAFFKSGESYYHSSLSFDRDQRESRYAIDVFRSFASIYSLDSLARPAKERIVELEAKLAEKDYSTAELYMKMEDYKAAIIYYDRVIDLFPNSEYARLAAGRKGTAQQELARLTRELELDGQGQIDGKVK